MSESFDIAVIGMACRFPGADDVEQFWHNLRDRVESITFFTDEELEKLQIRLIWSGTILLVET